MVEKESNSRVSKTLDKGKKVIEKGKTKVAIGLSALTLLGVMTSCGPSAEEMEHNPKYNKALTPDNIDPSISGIKKDQKTHTGLLKKTKGGPSTPKFKNNQKNNTEGGEVTNLKKETLKSLDLRKRVISLCNLLYQKTKLEKYKTPTLTGIVDGQEISLSVGNGETSQKYSKQYYRINHVTPQSDFLDVRVRNTHETKVTRGNIQVRLAVTRGTIYDTEEHMITLNVYSNTTLIASEFREYDEEGFKNAKTLAYLIYFNKCAEKLLKAYPSMLKADFVK